MKVKKYSTDKSKSNLKSRLQAYGTMAAAFMVTGGAYAQCGTADAANPILDIDIDGDGTTDVNLIWRAGMPRNTVLSSTLPIASNSNLLNTQIGTLTTSLFVEANFSYNGCRIAYIPAYYGYGFAGLASFQGDPAWGSFTTLIATAPIYSQINALGVFFSFYSVINGTIDYASAVGAGSNQIVGLSAAGSSVCAVIDAVPGVGGPNSVSLGSVAYSTTSFYILLVANSLQYLMPAATASIPVPTTTCFTNAYPTFGLYFPPLPVPISSAVGSVSNVVVGPFALQPATTGTGIITFTNSNPTTHFAVQFISGGETHNGWVEISIDPATSELTCLSTGFNSCSLESVADPADACIAVGAADPNADVSCSVMSLCEMTSLGLSAGTCDNGGTTAEDNSADGDDTFTLTINPAGTDLGTTYTISGDVTGSGTYGTPFTIVLPADGAAISVTVTDDTDPLCTLTEIANAPNACSMESGEVPTVGEWGLIILGLLMSITAIVGIRQRREEEVTA